MVYIAEAHALDGGRPVVRRGAPLVEEPMNLEERLGIAGKCMVGLELSRMTAVVDRMDNAVNKAYSAHPDRLYLVGKNGKLAYVGGRGPRGFKPNELEAAIQRELGK